MSNFTDFFPAASGGGGGGIPKYQEFTSSGTFTPTQALIDAGGRVAYMIVGGGERGKYDNSDTWDNVFGGSGGQVKFGYATLTSTTGCAVTIGAGGTSDGGNGGSSSVAFDSAGGTAVTANGGSGHHISSTGGFGANHRNVSSITLAASAHPGYLGGYGGGGGSGNYDFSQSGGGPKSPGANTGQGSCKGQNASAGFVRITWFE